MMDYVVIAGCGLSTKANLANATNGSSSSSSKTGMTNNEIENDAGMWMFQLDGSGTTVCSYKGCLSVKNGLAVVNGGASAAGNGVGCGDYLVAVQSKKNGLRFWEWRKEKSVLACVMPEKMGPIVSTRCGEIVVAGGSSGSCYVWEVSTGSLLRTWKAHYRAVSSLRLIDDDSFLVTGGDDSVVHAWNIGDLLDVDTKLVKPWMTYSQHSLPITDIWCGKFGLNSRIISCSQDQTMKLWNLKPKPTTIASIVLPCPINCCIADQLESWIFVGGENGKIYECDIRINSRPEDTNLMNLEDGKKTKKRKRHEEFKRVLEGHTGAVTCLEMSKCGTILVSGSLDGTCRLWDTYSAQATKVVRINEGLRPVVSLLLLPMPRELARASVPGLIAPDKKISIPSFKPFLRYQKADVENDGSDDVLVQFRACERESFATRKAMQDIYIPCGNQCTDEDKYQVANAHISSSSSSMMMIPLDNDHQLQNETAKTSSADAEKWKSMSEKLYSLAVDNFLDKFSSH